MIIFSPKKAYIIIVMKWNEKRMKDTVMKNQTYKKGVWVCVLVLATCACIILGILFLGNLHNVWVRAHFSTCAILLSVCLSLLCSLTVFFIFMNKQAAFKLLFSLMLLIFSIIVITFILQQTGFFTVFNNADSLQAYLERAGVWMPILYIALQFLQVVLLPIPSIISTVAGIALFGPFKTTVYSLIGIVLGSLLAFFIGRRWGSKAVAWMVGEENLKKWQKKLKGKDNLFLSAMFILPLFPDDVLCFLAGLSSMSFGYFVAIIVISRILAIVSTCYSVNFIPFNTWWGIALWVLFLGVILFTCIYVYKNMDKVQKSIKKWRNKGIFRKKDE